MKPTIGRIVHYRLTRQDAERINKRRFDFNQHRASPDYKDTGYAAHFGNLAHAGDVVPLIIVRVWGSGTSINGQALLDGTDNLWVTSVIEGDDFGQWTWPPRE